MKRWFLSLMMLALLCSFSPALGEAAQDSLPSGFDLKTNQTITFHGMEFSFPDYYYSLAEESSETVVEYYDSKAEGYTSLLFQLEPFPGGIGDFKQALPRMIRDMQKEDIFKGSELHLSEPFSVTGLAGWQVEFTGINMEGGENTVNTLIFAFLDKEEKVIMFGVSYDKTAPLKYDYIGDFWKMVETAKLLEEAGE